MIDPGQVSEGADGYQATQGEVKELVAEKRDEPSGAMLRNERGPDNRVRPGCTSYNTSHSLFSLVLPIIRKYKTLHTVSFVKMEIQSITTSMS